MLIRPERPADVPTIRAVHRAAFARTGGGEPVEAPLVDALRADPGWIPALSLVAETVAGDGTAAPGTVIGHVVCTRATLDGEHPVLGLGPIGVLAAHRRRGVGAALVHATCAAAGALGEPLVVLLGDPAFYRRFGFVAASDLDVEPPEPAWAQHFQARPLTAYDPARDRGRFRYAAPFEAL